MTNGLVMCATIFCTYVDNKDVRLIAILAAVLYAALSTMAALVLFGASTRPAWTKLFFSLAMYVQVLTAIGAALFPAPTIYDAYVADHTLSENRFELSMLQVGFVPYDIVLCVLFTPVILSHMNVRFKHHFLVCTASAAQLTFLSSQAASNRSPSLRINQSSSPLALLFMLPWLFMLLSVWAHERNDRIAYVLRKTQDDLHAQQLKVAHLESALCSGTRLFFTAPAGARTEDSCLNSSGHGPTVIRFLLVEDDAMNQLIMKAKLQNLRFGSSGDSNQDEDSAPPCKVECTVVDTAEKAIELVTGSEACFDIILMDQHLDDAGGVLTGLQAVTELRAQGHTLPIIMCTGNCAARDKEEYLLAGATHVWDKPYPATQQMVADLQDVQGNRTSSQRQLGSKRRN
jgi:CheY-like chemotaxis protein